MILKLFFFLLTGFIISTFVFTIHHRPDGTLAAVGDSKLIRDLVQNRFKRSAFLDSPDSQPQRRLPGALIIGVKKAGTRALLEYLRIHPNVRAPGPEVHFFDRYYDRGLDWYRRQMPTSLPSQVTVEKTPSYFVGRDVPQRVAAMNHTVKLILVVRDPVTRALSDYSQNAAKTAMERFESYAFINRSCHVNEHWGGVRLGLYWRHLRKWLEHFPLKNLLIVSGERLISEPASEMRRVEAFLNLPPVINDSHFYFNTTKGFPCINRRNADGESSTKARVKCLGRTKGRTHPKIAPGAEKCLRMFFAPHNHVFEKIVGAKFGWP